VVVGELFEGLGVEAVDARVAHMQVQLAPLEDQRAEGAHIAAVLLEAGVAGLGLGVQP
jgi:hypothetical protein